MGGLRKYMPITYLTVLIGALANAGFPPFAGFFSKDSIIEAVQLSHTFGAGFAWLMVLLGVFVGGFYSFRLVFYAFHGKERFETGHGHHAPHESPAVVTVPLVLLAIPSVVSGWVIGDVVFGGYFGSSITISEAHPGVKEMAAEFHGIVPMMLHGLASAPFWLALAGAAVAGYLYLIRPEMAAVVRKKAGVLVTILEDKYGFDRFNDWFFAGGARKFGTALWRWGDVMLIDGAMVNGTAKLVGWIAGMVRFLQSGYIYHYAFLMIIGVSVLLTWFVFFVR
jgi:NADH-quinone oxidoreductase subunit L